MTGAGRLESSTTGEKTVVRCSWTCMRPLTSVDWTTQVRGVACSVQASAMRMACLALCFGCSAGPLPNGRLATNGGPAVASCGPLVDACANVFPCHAMPCPRGLRGPASPSRCRCHANAGSALVLVPETVFIKIGGVQTFKIAALDPDPGAPMHWRAPVLACMHPTGNVTWPKAHPGARRPARTCPRGCTLAWPTGPRLLLLSGRMALVHTRTSGQLQAPASHTNTARGGGGRS